MLRGELLELGGGTTPFAGRQPVRNASFVEPRLVGEFDFHEWTASGMLRHPSYKGLRWDVDPRSVVRERAADTRLDREERNPARTTPGGDGATVDIGGRRVRLTNLRKVLYPAVGATKAQ